METSTESASEAMGVSCECRAQGRAESSRRRVWTIAVALGLPDHSRRSTIPSPQTGSQEDSMRFSKLLITSVAFVSMLGASAYAQDKAAQQAEVKAKAMQALQDFYKADPKLKASVAAAPGYAVFTTYGLSFGLGGAG